MQPKSSRDMPGPDPRKDTDRETREAVVKTPDKTNDWDRDQVHGEGETIGIESDRDDNLEMNAVIEKDGEVVEEDDDNAYQNSDDALPDDEEEAAIARHPTREGRFDET
ncbi:hypothetical protein ASD99_24585 [Mesorhizobium sp. Root695]|uniref:hypothetical protein n=1 Tax=Mesorhizobium sp. Root695 TaxID=1736589 RepID=UPI00070E2A7E|nr:hypothetical protein [Mesorhizobium sp. Root695]KRB29828.1 hypothetical protein ASD99_24585 [Mesorhizobium sp. Root695]